MVKTFHEHPPHATPEEETGPPNAERHGVRFILFNSVALAAVALGIIGLLYFLNIIG